MYGGHHVQLPDEIDGVDGIAGDDAMDVVDDVPVIVDTAYVMPRTNQLTLSFQGEVYVFDSVPPEKVQAVLLLLGGQELPPDVTSASESFHQIQDQTGMYDNPQCSARGNYCRVASLDKKIRYAVHKEVAHRMQHKKGQFTSSKTASEEVTSGSSDLNSEKGIFPEETHQKTSNCQHCGRKLTPMMRRGPAGSKSLCNACGLMWANKGTLKDLSKSTGTQSPFVNANEQSDANDSEVGSSCPTAAITSNGHSSAATVDA